MGRATRQADPLLLLRKREELGLTQWDVALKVGVRPQSYQAWESGRSIPNTVSAGRLAEALGLGRDELDASLAEHNRLWRAARLDREESARHTPPKEVSANG